MLTTRRALLTAFALTPLTKLRAAGRSIRLGGPVFLKSDDPRELAREHRRLGYSAAYCPNARSADGDRTRAIREAFTAESVIIAEVGAWKNMLDPDPAARKTNIDYVIERLALAEAVQSRCCVDIAGSYNPKYWYGMNPRNLSKEFFDATVENCRRVIDAVKPTRTRFTIEMMPWSLPDGPDVSAHARKVELDALSGATFDRSYVKNQIEAHQRTLSLLEKEVDSGKDPDAQAFALKALPTVQSHLIAVEKIAATLGIAANAPARPSSDIPVIESAAPVGLLRT